MNNYMYLVPIAAVIALLFAAYLAGKEENRMQVRTA